MRMRIDRTVATVHDGFPHFADPSTGMWTLSPAGDWTGGYWDAMLWLTAAASGDNRYARLAEEWTARLRSRVDSQSSARGLLFYYGAAVGAILNDNALARKLAIAAADRSRRLQPARRGHPAGRPVRGGAQRRPRRIGDRCRANSGAAIVGCASDRRSEIARNSHPPRPSPYRILPAGRRLDLPVRFVRSNYRQDDASLHHKGISDDSTWSRAQAWAMLGWALAAHWTAFGADRSGRTRRQLVAQACTGGSRGLLGLRRSCDSAHQSRHSATAIAPRRCSSSPSSRTRRRSATHIARLRRRPSAR